MLNLSMQVQKNHSSFVPSFVSYHWVCSKSNTMGVTCRAAITFPSWVSEFNHKVQTMIYKIIHRRLKIEHHLLHKTVVELRYPGRESNCCSACDTHRVTFATNPVIRNEWGHETGVICMDGSTIKYIYPYPKNDNKLEPKYKISSECSLSQNYKHYCNNFS
jgi:hypothetical protein